TAFALALSAAAAAGPLPASAQAGAEGTDASRTPRIFFLNIRGQVLSVNPDGSDLRVVADGLRTSPDGIAVDVANRHVYWSNMGAAKEDDGSVIRADFDGGNVTTIVPTGGTFTAKQLTIDTRNGKLYWSD